MPRFDVERLGPPVFALAAAGLLGLGLLLASRGVNRPPVVMEISVEPGSIAPGQTATVRLRAQDPDGDPLSYAFRAESGSVVVSDAGHPDVAHYTADAAGSADRVTVTVTISDGRGATAEGTVSAAIARAEAAAPTPEPEPDAAPAPTAMPPTPVPIAPRATRAPLAATPLAPPPRTAANRAPVVDGGQVLVEVAEGIVGLEAQGYDPDGDGVTHVWDFGGCLESQSSDANRADVKLRAGCDTGTAILTWTDPQGAAASTMWTITR